MRFFIDLDGVLADWEKSVVGIFNKPVSEIKVPVLWSVLSKKKTFWIDLEKTKEFDDIWDVVKELNPIILTGVPNTNKETTIDQKHQWCSKHLGDHIQVITCKSKEKQNYLENGDLLLDDNLNNCERWRDAGGVAIHHSYDKLSDVITELKFYAQGRKV